MFTRMTMTSAFALLLAVPAFADCNQELTQLESSIVAAETGTGTKASEMPATEHQQEALSGKQQSVDEETTGSTGKMDPASPHQEQVTGQKTGQSAERPSQLMADARKMAQSGDEAGCMKKVAEIKDLLGAQ